MARALALGAACSLAVALAGCGMLEALWSGRVPEFDVEEKDVLVVPFADHSDPRGVVRYCDSALGRTLARAVEQSVRESGITAEFRETRNLHERIEDYPDDAIPWDRLGRDLGVDCVILGKVTEYEVGEPGRIMYFPGRLSLELWIRDPDLGETVFERGVDIRYDPMQEISVYFEESESREKTRRVLIERAKREFRAIFAGIPAD